LTKRFDEYVSLRDALKKLRRYVRVETTRRELVPLANACDRVLFEDVVSSYDIPRMDSAHMDGFAVRASDLVGASEANPVKLKLVRGSPLGVVPKKRVRAGEAQTILTGGFMPKGADSVVQVERTVSSGRGVLFSAESSPGQFVYPKGRDVSEGERVLQKGRIIGGSDLVLLGSLHIDRVPVFARPRVAVIPTGDELTANIRDTRPGKVVETHGLLMARLILGAGGLPVQMAIARDDLGDIKKLLRLALRDVDVVLTLAGSSVGEADLTENAINDSGSPGVVVHGMKVHRGRVMGFGVARGKGVIILPGPIQGAVNAFALMAYPLIRFYLGRGLESPPSIPAAMSNSWQADRNPNFTKVVYCRASLSGAQVEVRASTGETEKITFLTQNDGYILVDENTTSLKKGDPVRFYSLPGLSSSSYPS
jgi:molybdopterin molybdotransferase